MIVYVETQPIFNRFCVYIRPTFIDARNETYSMIRLTRKLKRIKRQFSNLSEDYFYIEKK